MMPNFIVLGTAKAGTSSLYRYLKQHPQIYLSPQSELNFFAFEGRDLNFRGPRDVQRIRHSLVGTIEEYVAQFEGVQGEPAVGEISVHYLYVEQAPERIRHYVPDVKMIAILRDPVDRAFSAFTHMLREGREETDDFRAALAREARRIHDNWEPIWHYASMGHYARQLRRYFQIFDRDSIRVYLYDNYVANPLGVVQDMFRFLGVDDSFVPDMAKRHNVSRVPKNWRLHQIMTSDNWVRTTARALVPSGMRQGLRRAVVRQNMHRPRLDQELRCEFIEQFRDDILDLQGLLGVDLSAWLT